MTGEEKNLFWYIAQGDSKELSFWKKQEKMGPLQR